MQFKEPLQTGTLIKRYKRFLADIRLANGDEITIHCANTGSMKNCAVPGSQVWFSDSHNDKRKYRHTWEIVSVADGALAAGGTVVGVIPKALERREVAHQGVTELHIVASMHERKAMMTERSDRTTRSSREVPPLRSTRSASAARHSGG